MPREPGGENGAGGGPNRGDSKPLYYNPFPVKHRRGAVQEGSRSSTGHLLCVSIYVCIYIYV
jgi:hypothetical protein